LRYRGTRVTESLLWALLTCAIAATTAVIGYSVGSWAEEGEPRAAAQPRPRTAAPRLLPLRDIYASARADGYRAAEDRAYARGRSDGIREGRRAAGRGYRRGLRDALGRFSDWEAGRFYVVGIGAQPGAEQLGVTRRVGPLREGTAYAPCRGGTALCARRAR